MVHMLQKGNWVVFYRKRQPDEMEILTIFIYQREEFLYKEDSIFYVDPGIWDHL
jgi:hypothetical protein